MMSKKDAELRQRRMNGLPDTPTPLKCATCEWAGAPNDANLRAVCCPLTGDELRPVHRKASCPKCGAFL